MHIYGKAFTKRLVFGRPESRKFTLRIEDANRAASSIVKVKVDIGPYAGSTETFLIDIKNIPIVRD